MAETINKHGECPNCNCEWDGGDILEVISKLDALIGESYENVLKMAERCYGYTVENKKRFSKLITRQIKGQDVVYQCPQCMFIWDENMILIKPKTTVNENSE